MISTIPSETNFFLLFIPFAIGAIGALLLRNKDSQSAWWSGIFAACGSLAALVFGSSALYTNTDSTFSAFPSFFSFIIPSFHIDALSAFFIITISSVALLCSIYSIGYVKHFYGKYNIGVLGFFYNVFIASMLLVVSASNALFFLLVWELMSIASYFLVTYEHGNREHMKAGILYFAMTHAGTACIILAFLILHSFIGSFDFAAISFSASTIPPLAKHMVFLLFITGFGTKAGIIPLHVWLPQAHPAAPSHVSALMSGVMIKTGIYMIIRMLFGTLIPFPLWWGLIIILIGAASSLLGVLYALSEHDLKRLLAYHSIENIGLILLGIGSAMIFSSLHMTTLAVIGMTAALFHTINHALFKSLLFLSAGSVVNQTHTRNIEDYGGLIKHMPYTAFFFLIGSMAISALPPLNGFFSEWLTFQSLFQGIMLHASIKWIFLISAGALALTSGLAIMCFVKAFGITFLARARSSEAKLAKESGASLKVGMAGLAFLCIVFGVFSGSFSSIIQQISQSIVRSDSTTILVTTLSTQTISIGTFSSVSSIFMILAFMCSLGVVLIATKYLIYAKQTVRIGATWDCGTDITRRMEITATGFSRSIIMIFKGILKPTKQVDVEYHDANSRYLPKSRSITLGMNDAYQSYLYEPLNAFVGRLSTYTKTIQTGNVNIYVLYIFVALLVTLVFI